MASLEVDDITEESREMSPTVEESELSPTDQDPIAPPAESESTHMKEIPVSAEEKEKHPTEEDEEEETPAESWPIIEEAEPDASFETGSRGTTHDFGKDGDENEDDD